MGQTSRTAANPSPKRNANTKGLSWIRAFGAMTLLIGTGMLAATGACGDSGSSDASPCATVLAGKCGGPCANSTDCGAGLYCSAAKTCTADCAQGAASCAAGQSCSAQGQCVPGSSSGAGGADTFSDGGLTTSSSGGGGTSDGCADITVQFEKQIPTVVLLIDQSGSMTAAFPGGNRWNVLRNALMDPNNGVVKLLEKDVRFGLTLYTGADANPTCPILSNVSIALNNYDAINTLYTSSNPIEDTPTGESVDAVVKVLEPFAEPGPKIIVLATDGEPDSCTFKDPAPGSPEAQMARDLSVNAVKTAYDKKIQTFVIAVGDQISATHLQDVANAGAGKMVGGMDNAKYYQPTDQQALVDAFNEIINGARSCSFTLAGMVDPMQADKGSVVLDGQKLPYNDPNGWQLNTPTEIELLGTACDTIKQGDHTLSVTFPCGAVNIPN